MTSVVPHVGTWIEINPTVSELLDLEVVPHVGTWIEMRWMASLRSNRRSCLT